MFFLRKYSLHTYSVKSIIIYFSVVMIVQDYPTKVQKYQGSSTDWKRIMGPSTIKVGKK